MLIFGRAYKDAGSERGKPQGKEGTEQAFQQQVPSKPFSKKGCNRRSGVYAVGSGVYAVDARTSNS